MNIILFAYVISSCIVFSTFDKLHRGSKNLYVNLASLRNWIENPVDEFVEFDLNRYIRIRNCSNDIIRVEFGWIGGSDDNITGYRQSFYMSMSRLKELCYAITSDTVRTIVHDDRNSKQAHIVITERAAQKLKKLDKAEHRAFFHLLSYSFYWGNEKTVFIYSDIGKEFFFSDGDICGGICLHEKTIIGTDGETYIKPVYGIHT